MECRHQGDGKLLFLAEDYISGEQFAVRECGQCGLAYTDLSSTDAAVTGESFYPANYYGQEKRYPLVLGTVLNSLVTRRTKLLGRKAGAANGSVLDIGCGQGLFLKSFADRGWRAVGIEVSASAAFHAREVLGLEVLVGAQAIGTLESKSFDVVGLWHVLEHVEEPVSLLREARRVLKPGGRLLLSVPNFGSLEARLGKRNWFHLDVPRHLTHFTEVSLKATLDATGWEVVEKSYFVPEYDFFSFVQTVQNRSGLEMNLLYRMIRSGELKAKGAEKASLLQKVLAVVTFPVLAIFSLAYVPLANVLHQGSSVNLVLKKTSC